MPNYDSLNRNEPVIKGVKIRWIKINITFEQINNIFKQLKIKHMKKILMLFVVFLIPMMIFAQEIAPEQKEATFKMVTQWIGANWGWIATVLLAVSEGLASSKLKSNSIFQMLTNWLKKKSTFQK